MKNYYKNILWIFFWCLPLIGVSQIKIPAASPSALLKQTVGLTDITIEYSRPRLRERDMFTDLTREGEVWRTGANMSTKITFSDEVMLNGNKIPKGTYSLYSIPGQKNWTIIINKKISWGTQYDENEDLVRFEVARQEFPIKYETFTFFFGTITDNSCNMGFIWENTLVSMELKTEVASVVMAQIEEIMGDSGNPTDGDYYSAASYYMNNEKDMDKAL